MQKKKKKIAVVFFGQPRFIESHLASLSHKWWLRGAEVDYFGHCWFDPEISQYETAPWANLGKISMDPLAPKKIYLQYPGISLTIDKPQTFDIDYYKSKLKLLPDEEISTVFQKEIGNLSNTASQFLSMHRALATFESSAKVDEYDLVVLSRFDNFIWKMERPLFYPTDKLTLSNHHAGFPDLIYVGNLQLIKSLDIWDDFEGLISNERNLSAEYLKRKGFQRYFSQVDLRPIHSDITLLRGISFKYIVWTLPSMRFRRVLQIKTRLRKLFHSVRGGT